MSTQQKIGRIGADPEAFVTHYDSGDDIPIFGLLGGTKDRGIQMEGLPEGYTYLEDNAALEFNIPPQTTAKAFTLAIEAATEHLHEVLDVKRVRMTSTNCLTLKGRYLKDPRSQEIGCEPDYDAYIDNGKQRDKLSAAVLGANRYAGGHIHVQYNFEVLPQFAAAKFLDLFIVAPFLGWDKQGLRRVIYGRPGLFRPKPYGLEHRSSSNWWLFNARLRQRLATNVLHFANQTFNNDYVNKLSECYSVFPWEDLHRAILSEDAKASRFFTDLANTRFGLEIQFTE